MINVNFKIFNLIKLEKIIKNEILKKFLNQIQIPNLKKSEFYIYILKLEEEKYYIGKTANLEKRIEQHLFNSTIIWINLYKPISFEKIIVTDDELDEDKYVKKYMKQRGINNVRGGTYCNKDLLEFQQKALEKEIIHSSNRCFNCLGKKHFKSVN